MTKIGKVYREKITKTVRDGIENQSSAFVINFRNVSSGDICTLRKALQQKKVKITIDLKQGKSGATYYTCDFSFDYIKINASYRS